MQKGAAYVKIIRGENKTADAGERGNKWNIGIFMIKTSVKQEEQ